MSKDAHGEPVNDTPEIITFKKIYANTNTSNLKKVVLDIPTFEGAKTNFTVISDIDVLDYFYQGLLSFRFPTSFDDGGISIVNPNRFSVGHGAINTSVEIANGDSFAFTFEKVENTDHNYEYNIEVVVTPAESEPDAEDDEPKEVENN